MKYILHVDGDNFFAACLAAHNPTYRHKPIVVGKERGMAVAVSMEAKLLGVTRGMPIFHIQRHFPGVIVLDGDYPLFSRYSKRMYEILTDYSMHVEHYSVDECFADVSAYIKHTAQPPQALAQHIQKRIEHSLDISVSIGIGSTKTLAKLFSTHKKPHGCLTPQTKDEIHQILRDTPIEHVWGIGHASGIKLRVSGYMNALEFVSRVLPNSFPAPIHHIKDELLGKEVFPICADTQTQHSFMSSHSFLPTTSRIFLQKELQRHAVLLTKTLRKKQQCVQHITIYLLTKDRVSIEKKFSLHRPTQLTPELIECISVFFQTLPSALQPIRTTGILFHKVKRLPETHHSLFDKNKLEEVYHAIDALEQKGNRISLASCL